MWFLSALGILLVAIQLWPVGRAINSQANGPLTYLARSFKHAHWFHLSANLWGLSQLTELQERLSPPELIGLIIFSWVVSSVGLWIWHRLTSSKVITVGFSGVLFALLLVQEYLRSLNWQYAALTMIRQIVPHLLIPGISFSGHLIGILTGLGYVYLTN